MQGLFIMTPETMTPETGLYTFGLIDLTAGSSSVPLDDADDPGFSFLTERPGMHNLVFKDSCNGLILFGHQCVELGDIVVCNPTTKQWACVPIFGSPDRFNHTFLAFDPAVSSHFHLVQFQISWEDEMLLGLHAYSSETGTWSHNQIECQEEQGLLAAGWHRHVTISYTDPRCAFVNGFLYLLVWDLDQKRIIVLDVQGKARRMIEVPSMADRGLLSCYLEQSQGCLHFMTTEILDTPEENYKLSIWVLQDYDTQEWVLKNTVSSLEVFGKLTGGHILDFNFSVVDIHQDRNVVFLFHYDSGKLVAYDMDHKEVSVIAAFEKWRTPFGFARYVPCFSGSPALTS